MRYWDKFVFNMHCNMAMFQEKVRNIFFTTNDYRNYQAEVTTYDNSDYKVNIYMKKHY